jgi:glycosyltransferase involved in cell wall biosynthesis
MKSNKISIITIVFNDFLNIEKTIKSVLDQKYDNLEYILIDGGSTDGTNEIIKKYLKNISLYISESDSGISDAFNKGLNNSTGDIIAFLNSGDMYNPETLSFVNHFYNKNTFKVLCGAIDFYESNYYIKTKYSKPEKLTKEMSINHPSTFICSSLLSCVSNFNLNYKYAMDYDFFLKIYLQRLKFTSVTNIFTKMQLGGVSGGIHSYREELVIQKQLLKGYKLKYQYFYCRRYLIYLISTVIRNMFPNLHLRLKRTEIVDKL